MSYLSISGAAASTVASRAGIVVAPKTAIPRRTAPAAPSKKEPVGPMVVAPAREPGAKITTGNTVTTTRTPPPSTKPKAEAPSPAPPKEEHQASAGTQIIDADGVIAVVEAKGASAAPFLLGGAALALVAWAVTRPKPRTNPRRRARRIR